MKQFILSITILLPLIGVSQTWQQIGPEGGYFKEFTLDPNNSDIVYAGSDDGGGIWKSINAGSSWSLLTDDFPNMTGWKIVLDENDADVVYGCDLYGRYGVLKSIDAGANWTLINTGLSSDYDKMVSGLVVKTTDTLFIATGESVSSTPMRPGNGIYKSYDGGSNWIQTGLQGMTFPAIGKNEFGTIFAGSENNGLYYSNDNGSNWILHPDIPAAASIHEIETQSNSILLATTDGVFFSSDWGITFNLLGLAGEFNFDACLHKTSPDVEIYSSTLTGLKHYSSATGVWSTVLGNFFNDQIVIGITSDGTNVYCGGFSNSPIVKSADGGTTWNDLSESPIATEVNDIYVDPTNENRMFASLMGTYNINGSYDREAIYATTDGGLNWVRKGPDAHGLCLTVNPLNSNEFYLGSFAQGVYKTTDNFNTFSQLSPNGKTVLDVIVSIEDTSVVIISEVDFGIPTTDIKRSIDGGANFTSVSTIIANRLMFNPNDNDTVYAGTSDGVHLSQDNGVTFSPWLMSGEDCLTLKAKGSDLYVGTADGKIFKVSNNIALDISGPWDTPVELKSILIEEDHLFVGLSGAEKDTIYDLHGSVWQSDNDGLAWTNITSNMTSTNIYGNNIIESNGHELILATYGGGVYKSSGLNLSVNIDEDDETQFSVYPNPSSTNIQLSAVNIFLGEEYVIQDVNGKTVQKGQYNGNSLIVQDLPSGLYLIQFGKYKAKFTKD